MIQGHRYLESPILGVQRRRVKCQHPNSQSPHTSNSVHNCVSSPIRHRDQVLVLLEQVIRDREFARKTIVEHETELQSTHKAVARPFRILHLQEFICVHVITDRFLPYRKKKLFPKQVGSEWVRERNDCRVRLMRPVPLW